MLFNYIEKIIIFPKIRKPHKLAAFLQLVEQATGIEPAYSAWEANILPLNYACIRLF